LFSISLTRDGKTPIARRKHKANSHEVHMLIRCLNQSIVRRKALRVMVSFMSVSSRKR